MKNLILYSLICLFLFNCNNQKTIKNNKVSLEPTNDSIFIKIGKEEVNQTFLNQYFSEKDSNYLAILNDRNNTIYIYNLDKQKLLKKIRVEKEGENAFLGTFGYVIKNLDTIILISNWPPRIGILDGNGKILKTISSEKDEKGVWLSHAIPWVGQRGMLNGNNLLLIQELAVRKYSGKLTSDDLKQYKIAISINLENGNIISLPLNFTEKLVGQDIFSMSKCWEKGYNDCFVFSFSILGNLFVTQDYSGYREVPLGTDYQLKLAENLSKYSTDLQSFLKYEMETDVIRSIYYDKFREYYYILIRTRETETHKKEPSRANALYPNCFIIILDKDFKHLGDVYFPKNTYSFNNIFITQKGVYISEDHINNPTFSEDAMKYRLFKPE